MSGAVFPAPAAPIFRPVRRTSQARVVVIFQGCSLACGGGWGFRAGLTEPLSGHGALLRGAGGDRACLTGGVVVCAQYLRCNLFHNALNILICNTSQLLYLRRKLTSRKFIK